MWFAINKIGYWAIFGCPQSRAVAGSGGVSRDGLLFFRPLAAFLQNFLELTKEVCVPSFPRHLFNGRDKCPVVCNLDRDRAIAVTLRPDTGGELRRNRISSRDFHGKKILALGGAD